MMETADCREDLEAVRDWLRTADLDKAVQEIAHQGGQTIARFEVAHAPETGMAEYVGASFALLGIEAVARLSVMARDGQLDSDEADALVADVGGALNAAQGCLVKRDTEGARQFIESALDVLEL